MYQMHSEAKQYQNLKVWNRERFITQPSKEMGGPCLKNPKLKTNKQTKKKPQAPQKLSAKPFYRKGKGGAWLVAANFLMSNSLF